MFLCCSPLKKIEMIRKLLLLLFVFGLVVSCSTDNADDATDDSQISMEDDGMTDDDAGDDDTSDDDMMGDDTTDDDMMGDDTMDDDMMGDDTMDGSNDSGIDIIGLWTLSEIQFEEAAGSFELEVIREVVAALGSEGCFLISFDFMEDETVAIENRADFLNLDSLLLGGDLTCPDESTVETTMWSLQDTELTLLDENEQEQTFTLILEDENTLIIPGTEVDEELLMGAEAVFVRVVE